MISILIPVYNEERSLAELLRQIEEVCATNGYEKEVLFVDDGSTDTSWRVISELVTTHADVRAIRFRRNFGKAAALEAGFRAVTGDTVLTMDADLQDDPAEIPHFLARLNEGFDLVSGWKQQRQDPWHKVFPSRVFNGMVSGLTGVFLHDHNCGMKAYRRDVVDEIHLYGEMHRFTPVLAAARGFRVGEIVIRHRARPFGVSKYGFSRFLKGFFDLLTVKLNTTYGQRPLHVLGTFGLVGIFIGFVLQGILSLLLSFTPHFATFLFFYFNLFGNIFLSLGEMFLVAGVLAELLTNQHQNPQPANYAVAEVLESTATPSAEPLTFPQAIDPDQLR